MQLQMISVDQIGSGKVVAVLSEYRTNQAFGCVNYF